MDHLSQSREQTHTTHMLTILESSQTVRHTQNLTRTQATSFSQMWTQIARWGFSPLNAETVIHLQLSRRQSHFLLRVTVWWTVNYFLFYIHVYTCTQKSAHEQPYTINKCHLYANDPDRNSDTSERPALSTTTTAFFQQTSHLRESWYKQTSLRTAKIVARHSQIFTKDLFTSVTQYSWMGV